MHAPKNGLSIHRGLDEALTVHAGLGHANQSKTTQGELHDIIKTIARICLTSVRVPLTVLAGSPSEFEAEVLSTEAAAGEMLCVSQRKAAEHSSDQRTNKREKV